MVGGFRRHDHDRNALEIDELARRRLLHPAYKQIRPVGLGLALDCELGRLLTGGSYVTGMSVSPQGRALPVAMIVASNGGPAGSIAMIALTSRGRASAINQPKGPDCEWVSTIAGPILSSSAAPAS